MAVNILTNASVVVNSIDLSDHVRSVRVTMTAEDVDLTAMGAVARTHAPGLRDDRIELTMFQDWAASKVDATLSPLVGVAAGTVVTVKGTSSSTSSTNPTYSGTMCLLDYTPIDGEVGAANMTTVVFVPAAGSYITRATT